MAITSTDNQTAAAPIVEVAVANETDLKPADETSEPAPAETSKPVSCPQRQRCSVQTLDPHAPRYLSTTPQPSCVLNSPAPGIAHRLRPLPPDICEIGSSALTARECPRAGVGREHGEAGGH